MFGFMIAPKGHAAATGAPRVFASLRTLTASALPATSTHELWLTSTGASNNHRAHSPHGRDVIVCGTLVMGRLRGAQAAARISQRLDRGEQLEDFYDEFRGPFALLVIDQAHDRLTVASDRDGLMPVFRSEGPSPVVSTHLLPLAALAATRVNALAVQEFVHGGGCVAGRTLFDGLSRLPKATIFQFGRDARAPRTMWAPAMAHPYLKDDDRSIIDHMHGLFTQALDIERVDPNKPFAADLTAGTDSRTVLSFLLHGGTPLVASSAGPAGHVDVERSKEIARRAGIEHWWYQAEPRVDFDDETLDEYVEHGDAVMSPFGMGTSVPYFKEKARRFDMLFGGNGGPLFKDHYWLFEFNRIDRDGEPNWDRIARWSLTEGRVNEALFVHGVDYLDHMKRLFLECSERVSGTNNQKLDFVYFDFKCQYLGSPQYGFANRFIDLYHPMCDARLVEYSYSVRPWVRLRARLQSELIHRNHKSVAWVPTDNYVPCVPDTGWRLPLRLTRGIRYARAARRKVNDFIFNKKQFAPDPRATSFMASLDRSSLAQAAKDVSRLRLSALLDAEEVSRLIASSRQGAHSGYVQRLFAIEAILAKVAQLAGRSLDVPAA